MLVVLLLTASLGFAQSEPNSSTPPVTEQVQATTTTTTATATATSTTPAPTAVTTQPVTVTFDVTVPISTPLKGGVASGLVVNRTRPLTRAESEFLKTVPNGKDSDGQSYRDLIEVAFRSGIAHAETAPSYGTVDNNGVVYDYSYYCRLVQPADASKPVTGRVEDTLHGTATGTINVPVITVKGADGAPGRPGETVYVQPAPAPQPVCQQQAPAQYCPPPPPPQRVLFYTVPKDPYGSPVVAQNNGCNQQSAYIPQYNAWDRLGQVLLPFALKPEPNNWSWSTVISNGSSSNSNATNNNSNTAYGGAGGAGGQGGSSWSNSQGGNAWQNQGQGMMQGQWTLNDITNTLNNINDWLNANQNTLNGGDQTTGVGVTTNTGVAVH